MKRDSYLAIYERESSDSWLALARGIARIIVSLNSPTFGLPVQKGSFPCLWRDARYLQARDP